MNDRRDRAPRTLQSRRVKIIGAGSVGNHLANAARQLDWSVVVCDIDPAALQRMREDIYPARYGSWDTEIELLHFSDAPRGSFDVIFIGTPPDSHLPLAIEALDEGPGVLVIEKPLCPPTLDLLDHFRECTEKRSTKVLVGYNHVVGRAARRIDALLKDQVIGTIQSIDVDFREHWGGIFQAHPWLRGPTDSYLGSWERGGGAGGEHSHGLNLWQHFALEAGGGRVTEVTASLLYVDCGSSTYDSICSLNILTEGGVVGRVMQDVVTSPPRKAAAIHGSKGRIEWIYGYRGSSDAVVLQAPGTDPQIEIFEKDRANDFLEELRVVENLLAGRDSGDSISLERAMETALVLHAGHRSEKEKRRMYVDYSRGFVPDAVGPTESH